MLQPCRGPKVCQQDSAILCNQQVLCLHKIMQAFLKSFTALLQVVLSSKLQICRSAENLATHASLRSALMQSQGFSEPAH